MTKVKKGSKDRINKANEAMVNGSFPLLTSECLDNTDWGNDLVNEFGRVEAERIILFLNRNGYSFRVPVNLDQVTAGNISIKFEYQEYDRSHRVLIMVDGEVDRGIESITIPTLKQYDKMSDLKFDIKYVPNDQPKIFRDDKDLKSIDFEYLDKQMYHVRRLKISDGSKRQIMTTIIYDYLYSNKLECPTDKVLDILDLTKKK